MKKLHIYSKEFSSGTASSSSSVFIFGLFITRLELSRVVGGKSKVKLLFSLYL